VLRWCTVISAFWTVKIDLGWLLGVGCFRHWNHHSRYTAPEGWKVVQQLRLDPCHMVCSDRGARFRHGRLLKVLFLANFGGSSFSTGTALHLSKKNTFSPSISLSLCVCKCVIERKGVRTPGIIVVMLLARKRRTWRCDVLRWKLWVKTRKEVTLHQACINLFPWRWEWETRALPFYPRSNRGLVLVTKPSRKQNLFFLINSSSSWFWKKEKVVRTLLI
jgi:hypothetical protein